jgi:formylglycine-generating enzyme required for sulfatase activity
MDSANASRAEPEALQLNHSYNAYFPDEFPAPWAYDWGEDTYGLWVAFRYRGVRQQLRWIEPGEFMMGSPENEAQREDNEIQHQVSISNGFWLADTVCTQALWQAVMGKNPSKFEGEDRPVDSVNWKDAQRFIEKLNAIVPGQGFRLPKEAEWEYACRAGTETPFWFGDQITPEQVNYDGNYPYVDGKKGQYRKVTLPVKALTCNGWGLYQMHGNVWEWCQDWYGDYDLNSLVDPTGPAEGRQRVLRGGSWLSFGGSMRSAQRFADDPGFRSRECGFRLARGQASGQEEAGGKSG